MLLCFEQVKKMSVHAVRKAIRSLEQKSRLVNHHGSLDIRKLCS